MTLIEAGKLVNTHGVRGELKLENYCTDEVFFQKIETLYINDIPYKILSQRGHKAFILLLLEGVDTIEQAMALKNKIAFFDKDIVKLAKNQFYIADILGFTVFDKRLDKAIGPLIRVEEFPASKMYIIDVQGTEVLIPDVPAFVQQIDFENKQISINTIHGMMPNEN